MQKRLRKFELTATEGGEGRRKSGVSKFHGTPTVESERERSHTYNEYESETLIIEIFSHSIWDFALQIHLHTNQHNMRFLFASFGWCRASEFRFYFLIISDRPFLHPLISLASGINYQ